MVVIIVIIIISLLIFSMTLNKKSNKHNPFFFTIITFLFFLLITTISYSQITSYGNIIKQGNIKIYRSKDGTILNIKDTLTIGLPTNNRFTFITQGAENLPSWYSGNKVIINKMKVYGTTGNLMLFVSFKDIIKSPLINYEFALQVGEIINNNAPITHYSALKLLKEKKDLLNLELITQTEYDKIKQKLAPIILSKD